MVGEGRGDDSSRVPSRPLPASLVPLDLTAFRARHDSLVADVAADPVQHLPAALVEALQGAWGSPEELGLAPTRPTHLRLVAG